MVAAPHPQPLADEESDVVTSETPQPIEIENPIIEARDVRFTYGGPQVLHGIDLEVRPGEVVVSRASASGSEPTPAAPSGEVAPPYPGRVAPERIPWWR